MKHIDLNNSGKDIQDIYYFLQENNIPVVFPFVEHSEYCRELSFKINSVWHTIIWFKNQCTLWIGEKNNSACIPFRYIYIDNTHPFVSGNLSLGFSYEKFEPKSISDRMFPYSFLRIPMKQLEDN